MSNNLEKGNVVKVNVKILPPFYKFQSLHHEIILENASLMSPLSLLSMSQLPRAPFKAQKTGKTQEDKEMKS